MSEIERLVPRALLGPDRHAYTEGAAAMEIGEPIRTYTVEPLEDPVPREVPEEPPEEPAEAPDKPERVPA